MNQKNNPNVNLSNSEKSSFRKLSRKQAGIASLIALFVWVGTEKYNPIKSRDQQQADAKEVFEDKSHDNRDEITWLEDNTAKLWEYFEKGESDQETITELNAMKDQHLDSLQHTVQTTIDDLAKDFPEFMTPEMQKDFAEALASQDGSKYEELSHTLQSQLEWWHQVPGWLMMLSKVFLCLFAIGIMRGIQGKRIGLATFHGVMLATTMLAGIAHPELYKEFGMSLLTLWGILAMLRASRMFKIKPEIIEEIKNLSPDQINAIHRGMGPLSWLMLNPSALWWAFSTTLAAPLKEWLKQDPMKYKDNIYFNAQSLANMDTAAIGMSFPTIYLIQNFGLEGLSIQAKTMILPYIFHKIYQLFIYNINPLKHASTMVKYLWPKNRDFDFKAMFKEPEHTHENMISWLDKLIQKVVEDKEIDAESKERLIAGIQSSKKEFDTMEEQDHSHDNADATKNQITHNDLDQKMTTLFGEFRENGDQEALMYELVEILKDGHISTEELETLSILFRTGDLKEIENKRSWFSKAFNNFIAKAQGVLDLLFDKMLHQIDNKGEKMLEKWLSKLKADHVEMDIVKVGSFQLLAVGLLLPVLNAINELGIQSLSWAIDTGTTALADNIVATSLTRSGLGSQALALADVGGMLTLFGNLAHFKYLESEWDLATSLKMSKYALPTILFTLGLMFGGDIKQWIGIDSTEYSPKKEISSWEKDSNPNTSWENSDIISDGLTKGNIDSLKEQWILHTLQSSDIENTQK